MNQFHASSKFAAHFLCSQVAGVTSFVRVWQLPAWPSATLFPILWFFCWQARRSGCTWALRSIPGNQLKTLLPCCVAGHVVCHAGMSTAEPCFPKPGLSSISSTPHTTRCVHQASWWATCVPVMYCTAGWPVCGLRFKPVQKMLENTVLLPHATSGTPATVSGYATTPQTPPGGDLPSQAVCPCVRQLNVTPGDVYRPEEPSPTWPKGTPDRATPRLWRVCLCSGWPR